MRSRSSRTARSRQPGVRQVAVAGHTDSRLVLDGAGDGRSLLCRVVSADPCRMHRPNSSLACALAILRWNGSLRDVTRGDTSAESGDTGGPDGEADFTARLDRGSLLAARTCPGVPGPACRGPGSRCQRNPREDVYVMRVLVAGDVVTDGYVFEGGRRHAGSAVRDGAMSISEPGGAALIGRLLRAIAARRGGGVAGEPGQPFTVELGFAMRRTAASRCR